MFSAVLLVCRSLISLLAAAWAEWLNTAWGAAESGFVDRGAGPCVYCRLSGWWMELLRVQGLQPRYRLRDFASLFSPALKLWTKLLSERARGSLGLLCQILVCPSCLRWLIALDSAKASALKRFWEGFLVPFKSFGAFFLRPVRSTVYSPQGDKADTVSRWMDCSSAADALSLPLNPVVMLEMIKYSFDGGTSYEDEGRIPSVMSI